MKRVLVTGANGFVGFNTCRLLREGGFVVRAAVRRAGRLPARLSEDEIVVPGDIGPGTEWGPVLEGVSAVVHLAGRVHVLRETVLDPQGEFYKANVDGTERLARAAASARVRRFVYVSSIGVNGKSTHGRPFTEGYTPSPHNSYAISKWEAEQSLRRVAEETGLGVTVLRPPLIYGPGVKANFLRLMRLVNRGLPLPLRSIDNRRSLIYVANLANAIAVCLDHPKAAGETFLVSDGEDVSTPELIRRIARSLGRSVWLLPLPPPLVRAAGRLMKQSASVEPLLDSLEMDSSKIARTLGWRPPSPMMEGLEETAKWFMGEAREVSPGHRWARLVP